MKLEIRPHEHMIKVMISGQFTFADHQKFKEILVLSQAAETGSIELDFSEVDFIDSAGLGLLLLLRDSCQQKHLSLSLNAPKGQVAKIFHVSKFDQLFSITP